MNTFFNMLNKEHHCSAAATYTLYQYHKLYRKYYKFDNFNLAITIPAIF